MAVDEVNEKLLGPMGHSLDFVVAETYGQEEVSIRQVRATSIHKLCFTVHLGLNIKPESSQKSRKSISI